MKKIMVMGFLMISNSFCMEDKEERSVTFHHEETPKSSNHKINTEISCSFKSKCVEKHKQKLFYGATGSILGFLLMLLIHLQTQKTC